MAHKVHVKKLSADEKKRKQVRHEQKMATKQTTFGADQVTQAQINEIQLTVMTDMNNHIRAIIEANHPEALSLVGADFFDTTQQFAATGMTDMLKQALKDCKEEREAFVAFALLSWAKQNTPAGTI